MFWDKPLEPVPAFPVIPGDTICVLLAPLDLSSLIRGCGLQNEAMTSDTLELRHVAFLRLSRRDVNQMPAGEHKIKLPVRELLESRPLKHVAVKEVRWLAPRPLAALLQRLTVYVEAMDVAVPPATDLPEVLRNVAAGLHHLTAAVKPR